MTGRSPLVRALAAGGTVVVLAGGYARTIADTVDIHAATISEAARVQPPS